MAVDHLLKPWSGRAFRHVPAGIGVDVLDVRYAGRSTTNRWNAAGQPSLYLAGDEGVLIAEWGWHFTTALTDELLKVSVRRAVYRLDLAVDRTLDLRDREVCEALSLTAAPFCFVDVAIARATANFIRQTTAAQASFVPSIAFPHAMDRWCLVLFLEKLPDLSDIVSAVTPSGPLRWG